MNIFTKSIFFVVSFIHRQIFIICLLTAVSCANVDANTDKFYGLKDKLSNSHVNNIYQDKHGFIWVCTDNGLNVFDGSEFKTYYHRQNDTTSLCDNSVLSVLEDKKGNFWVGTTSGLQLFNRDTEQFSTIHFSYPRVTDFSYFSCILEDSKGNIWVSTSRSGTICLRAGSHQPIYFMQTNSNICSNKINTLFEDRFGNIWIGSQDNGISILNIQNHTLVNYSSNTADNNSLSSNKVFSILENKDGNILVGTIDGGINLFNYSEKKFLRNYIPSGNVVFTMRKGNKNNLWIGTDGLGLQNYDYNTKQITTYETDLNTVDLRKAKVHSVMQDNQGNLWIALYQDGILMIPDKKKVFKNIGFNPFYFEKSIGSECVLSVLEDSNGKVWVGTDGDGIYRLNSQRKVEKHYSYEKLNASVILSIFEDQQKRIWIGTYWSGLFLYDNNSDSFRKVSLNVKGKDIKDINIIRGDHNGNLWIGTNENGLCTYNPTSNQTSCYTYDILKSGNQISSNSVQTIFLENNFVWIGTSSAGLSCLNTITGTFSDYNKLNRELNNNITTILRDNKNILWIGTKQGLYCVNNKNVIEKSYTVTDGLANSSVTGIEVDKHNNLWISTSLGISHFNQMNHSFINYYVSDGLINDEYRRGACFQSKSGELFFGGTEGLSSFFPFKIEEPVQLKNLVFTNLFIYNEKVEVGDNSYLKKNINVTEKITIDHSIKSFSLGFVAIEYNNPGKIVYQVKMDGFDNEWKTLPMSSKLATYTNLRYGNYKFHVKAYFPNSDPIERSIVIVVLPPFWLTWWAKLLYVLIILALGYWGYKRMLSQIEKREVELQKDNEKQIMQSKLQFFTDISHEIRTPLTLILTPVEKLIKETPEGSLRNTYKLINLNGQRILRLVNQIMEMRKLDRGQVKLITSETDVQEFIREITSSFQNIITEQNCEFNLEFANDLPRVWIDHEKLDKVIFNVLSNAFKYTPNYGKISLKVDTFQGNLRIRISDSGPGISPDQREVIFNRFYQIQGESNRNKLGTGIGLHLSKSLLDIHHGKIYVDNSAESGACFVILIPIDTGYLQPNEMSQFKQDVNLAVLVQPSLTNNLHEDPDQNITLSSGSRYKHKLLIVEDNNDIRNYIFDILEKEYQIIQAENGNQGLELAIKEMPDCIITDVMMDGMDGIELCKKIKSNDKTCHIPVIILTAKTSVEQRIEGLEVGADSYIPKPFNIDHLRIRISKLIELRQTIKNKYEGKYEITQEQIKIKSVDEKLFEKFESIVKEQLDNPDLSIEIISQQIGISRSQLQRKLKQITNQNPSDYLKTMRLKYAAILLTSKNLSISEVTYACGFASLSHFSNSFREFYGMSPSRYVEINKNKPLENESQE